jgi:biopolymer transport protein ExbB/TolQ
LLLQKHFATFLREKGKSVRGYKINVKMLVLTIICAVLTLSLVFSVLFILKQNEKINETKATLAKAESANSALTSAKDSYESQIAEKDNKISALESQVTYLQKLRAEKQNQSSQSAKPAVDTFAAAKKALLELEGNDMNQFTIPAKG